MKGAFNTFLKLALTPAFILRTEFFEDGLHLGFNGMEIRRLRRGKHKHQPETHIRKNLLVKPVSFAYPAFEQIAFDSPFEITLGYAHQKEIRSFRRRPGLRKHIIIPQIGRISPASPRNQKGYGCFAAKFLRLWKGMLPSGHH